MRGKRRLVPIWIKILLLVFAVLFVLSASAGIWSIFALRQTTKEMPYPAVAGYQLYPVDQEIGIGKYPAGSLLLIRRQNHYSVGEELALPAERNDMSAAPFVRVTEIDGDELTVQQMAAPGTEMRLSSAEACGRVTHVIPVAGYPVAALFGEWNWLYFLVIPAVFPLAFAVTAICVAGSRRRHRTPSLAFSARERFDLFEEDLLPEPEGAPANGPEKVRRAVAPLMDPAGHWGEKPAAPAPETPQVFSEPEQKAEESSVKELPQTTLEELLSAREEYQVIVSLDGDGETFSPPDIAAGKIEQLEELLSFNPDREVEEIKRKNALYEKKLADPFKSAHGTHISVVQEEYHNRNVDGKDKA